MVGDGDLRGEITIGNGNGMASHTAYGHAKLCNNLFAFELNRRMQQLDWPVVANTLHTGSVATKSAATALGDLFHGIRDCLGSLSNTKYIHVPLLWRSPDAGASTLLFAALSDVPPSMKRGGQYVDAFCRLLLDVDKPVDPKIVKGTPQGRQQVGGTFMECRYAIVREESSSRSDTTGSLTSWYARQYLSRWIVYEVVVCWLVKSW